MKLGKVLCGFAYLLCMVFTGHVMAQEFEAPGYTQYTQYTSTDGLSSSEIHSIYQDSDGFIWIGTDQGLCRFDSEHWRVFTSIDGLPDNMVISIKEDEKGHLWLQGLNGTIFRLNRSTDEIYVPEFNDELDKLFLKNRLHEWHIDSKGSGYLSIYEVGSYKAWDAGSKDVKHDHFLRIENFQIVEQIALGEYRYQFFKWSVAEKELWAYNRAHNPSPSTFSKALGNGVVGFGSSLVLPGFSSHIGLSGALEFFQPTEHRLLLAINHWLIEFDTEANKILSKTAHPDNINEIFQDRSGNIFLGYQNQKGACFYNNGDLSVSGEVFLEGNTVTSFFEDRDNALWVGTMETGLMHFSRSEFMPVSLPQDALPITQLRSLHDRTFLIGNSRSGYELTYENGNFKAQPLISLQSQLSDLWCKTDTCVACSRSQPPVLFKDNEQRTGIDLDTRTKPKAIISTSNGRALGYTSGLGYVIYDFKALKDVYVSSQDKIFLRVNCALELSNGNVIIGTEEGIKQIADSAVVTIFPKTTASCFIYDLVEDEQGYLWVATKGNGLYRIHLESDSFNILSTAHGLPLNSIYDLEIAQGIVLGATNKGLFSIKNLDKGPGAERVETWTTADGLPFIEIQELASTSKHLLINCSGELVSMELKTLIKTKTGSEVILRNISVNDVGRSAEELSKLKADQNNIRIRYQGFHYGQKAFSYWYKTKATDKWTKTNNTELNLVDLVPGVYDIMVSPFPEDIPNKTMKLSFEIAPPFTKTLAFLLLVVFGSLGVLSLAFWMILSRERLSRKLLVSQQQALTSQMNPHFIFNALNSVQYFVGEGRKKLAQSYLGEFAILMRQVLDSSRSGQISLEQEIASLKTYIELERLRFEEQYDFSFDIDPETEQMADGIILPSMVVQPYVENAILHGLRPKDEGGHLLLQFGVTNDLLRIAIKDNGVGRKAASEREERKNHTSHGMNITTERIDLLNKRLKKKISITVFDLEPAGTEVILLLPFESIF